MGLFDGGEDQARRARETLQQVALPQEADLRLQLEQLVQQGLLTPEQFQALLQGQSAFEDIQEDPQLAARQSEALEHFRGLMAGGGQDAVSEAALRGIQAEQDVNTRGLQEAIMENARMRGVAGSPLEFTQRMISQQAQAGRASNQAVQQAAIDQQRRDAAAAQTAGLAGSQQAAQFGRAATRAQASDAISRFNTELQNQASQANVAARNQAQAANLAERQRVADQNTAIRNQQQIQNTLNTPLELAGLRLNKAGAVAGARQQEGAVKAANAAQNRQMLGSAITSVAGLLPSDERAKTDIVRLRPGDLGAAIEQISFKYKGAENGKREVGIPAQDLEKVAPAAVVEGPDGLKRIDMNRVGGLLLAAMSDVSKRLRALEGGNGERS